MANDSSQTAVADPLLAANRRPKRKMGLGGCLLTLGVFSGLTILVSAIAYLNWAHRAEHRVDQQLAKLRAAGQPTTAAELDAYYALPSGVEDVTALWLAAVEPLGTPRFRKAAKDLPIVGDRELAIPPPGAPWPEQTAVRQLLDDYAESLGKMHEAAQRGGAARFPVQFEDGLAMLLPHAQKLRPAAHLLALEARVRAREGDAQGAVESIRAIFAAGHSLEHEPIIVSQLVRFVIYGVGCQEIEALLPHLKLSDADLEMLQKELRREDFAAAIRCAFVGERGLGLLAAGKPTVLAELTEDEGAWVVPKAMLHENLALYLETMNKVVLASERPWPVSGYLMQQFEQDMRAQSTGINKSRYMVADLLLPSISVFVVYGAHGEALRNVFETALAVERFRLEHGRSPESLDQLVPGFLPAIPTDPFDGQPLRFVLSESEVTLYSIGRDGTDNGGEGDLGDDDDVVLRLPR